MLWCNIGLSRFCWKSIGTLRYKDADTAKDDRKLMTPLIFTAHEQKSGLTFACCVLVGDECDLKAFSISASSTRVK